ncbi:hypothetical protein AB0D65_31830 [Streptomyces griseoloalbus]|uniref:Transcriptional regulator SbtR-like C-terminal domain-containing protein n=1 Tax=Streptomyces griseoloalbus TaxID=67303 RepID=A0ABV3EEY9_9ACTN
MPMSYIGEVRSRLSSSVGQLSASAPGAATGVRVPCRLRTSPGRRRLPAFCGDRSGPGDALIAWLRDLNIYAAASRGLASSLLSDGRNADLLQQNDACRAMTSAAADELLHRARQAGTVRPGVHTEGLLGLVNAISLATEHHDDDAQANRLLTSPSTASACRGDTP